MQDRDFSAICSACQHEIGSGSAMKPSRAKALDCKHTLCSDCFTSRIRILHQDKIMVLKCPISTCRTVTTKALPIGYCTSARKFGARSKSCGFKTRPVPSSAEKKKKESKEVLLEQFNDAAVSAASRVLAQPAMHSDIEWTMYGVRVLYTIVLLGAAAGIVCGYEALFSNPQAHLDSYYSSSVLPLLVFVLLVAEFVPPTVFAAHQESMKSVQIVDILLVIALCGCSFGDVNYGATHSLGRYLSMSLTTHFLPLLVLSVVALKIVSIVYGMGVYVCSVASIQWTRVRTSSLYVRIFGSTKLVPTITSATTSKTATPSKLTSSTVRTMGLQYDSRYVCAPSVLSISSGSMYGDGMTTDSVYSDSVLTIEDAANTLYTDNAYTNTFTNPSPKVVTHTNSITDQSPTVQSDGSTESAQVRKTAMSMLVDGYAWDNGVDTTINMTKTLYSTDCNHNSDVFVSDTVNVAAADFDVVASVNVNNSPTPSSEVYAMYNEIVHSIKNLTTINTTLAATSVVDTTPMLYPTSIANGYLSTSTRNTSLVTNTTSATTAAKYDTIYHDEYDTQYADKYLNDSFEYTQDIVFVPDTIYIPPGQLDLSMESDILCVDGGVYGVCDTNAGVCTSSSGNSVGGAVREEDGEADSLAYSTNSNTNSIKSSNSNTPSNPHTPNNTTTSTRHINTLPYTPYTLPSGLNTLSTVDVYNQPTPLFRVPRIPTHYTDLNTSPYVTPMKGTSVGGASSSDLGCGISALMFSTPTKSTDNNTSDTATYTYNSNTAYSNTTANTTSSVLHTPLHTTSSATAAESPDDEFKLHSNIKLKPLGMFGIPLHYDSSTGEVTGVVDGTNGKISSRARSIYSSSVFNTDMYRNTTVTTGSVNATNAIPDSYYSVYSNPVSPVKGMNTSVDSIACSDSVAVGVGSKHTSTGTNVMSINRVKSSDARNSGNISDASITQDKRTNKAAPNNAHSAHNVNNVNNNAQQHRKGILLPSMNLIR